MAGHIARINADEQADVWRQLTTVQLLCLYARTLSELQNRRAIRSRNNPIADYAEHLFCTAFSWSRSPPSSTDIDAVDSAGRRYQIKCRRITIKNPSRLLGALRRLPEGNFDVLAGILFNEQFEVHRAALIPHAIVSQRSSYRADTNSWRFHLRDTVWAEAGVVDVTESLRAAAQSVDVLKVASKG